MELSLREWLIIGGGIVVALIVLDGWRRMRGNRNTLKMSIDTSLTDIPEENFNPELPGGGFRVLDSDGNVVKQSAEDPKLKLNTFVDKPTSAIQTSEPDTALSAERDPLFEPLDDFNSLSEGVSAVRVVKSQNKAEPEFDTTAVVDPVVIEEVAADPVDEIPVVSETYVPDLGPATDQYDQAESDSELLFEASRNDDQSRGLSDAALQTSSIDQSIALAEDDADSDIGQQSGHNLDLDSETEFESETEFKSVTELESEPEFKEPIAEEQLSFDTYSESGIDLEAEPEPEIIRPDFSVERTNSAEEDDLIASLPEGFNFDPQPTVGRVDQSEAVSVEDDLDLTRPVTELMKRVQSDDSGPQQENIELVEAPEPELETALAPLPNDDLDITEPVSLFADDVAVRPDVDSFVEGQSLQTLPEADKVLVISVVAPDGTESFNGRSLLQIVLACGMRYGDMKIFHRYEDGIDEGAIQFSMTNALEPGYFEVDEMDQLNTRGVTFFMSMEEPRDVMNAYECMLATAEAVAKNLHGELMDENRSTMRTQTKEHYRERIRKFEMRKLKQPN